MQFVAEQSTTTHQSDMVINKKEAMSMQPAELSVVIPTFNERGNLGELIKRITAALEGIRWEVIVVDDDSPDGTAAEARTMYGGDARVSIRSAIHVRLPGS